MVTITARVRALFYVKGDVREEKGLGSWVRALICCLTPDTEVRNSDGGRGGRKKEEGEWISFSLSIFLKNIYLFV